MLKQFVQPKVIYFSDENSVKMINQYNLYDKYASIYYAYNAIHRYMVCTNHDHTTYLLIFFNILNVIFSALYYLQEDPFMSYQPETLFNISRFLMNETRNIHLKGVSKL